MLDPPHLLCVVLMLALSTVVKLLLMVLSLMPALVPDNNKLVLVMAVSGARLGVKLDVYRAVPETTLAFVI
jgi:hypothetical protein